MLFCVVMDMSARQQMYFTTWFTSCRYKSSRKERRRETDINQYVGFCYAIFVTISLWEGQAKRCVYGNQSVVVIVWIEVKHTWPGFYKKKIFFFYWRKFEKHNRSTWYYLVAIKGRWKMTNQRYERNICFLRINIKYLNFWKMSMDTQIIRKVYDLCQ